MVGFFIFLRKVLLLFSIVLMVAGLVIVLLPSSFIYFLETLNLTKTPLTRISIFDIFRSLLADLGVLLTGFALILIGMTTGLLGVIFRLRTKRVQK